MIVLRSVSKTYGRWRLRKDVLVNVDAVFEARGNYVIFGVHKSGKSTLLNLLSGIAEPTRGTITRYGKVGFTIGYTGIGQARYSGRELAVLLATLYEADADEIIDFTTSFSELGPDMRRPIATLDQNARSRLYVTLGYALPLDFYLFDGTFGGGDDHFRRKCASAFEARKEEAGTIWVTRDHRNPARYGTKGGVLHEGKLTLFDTMEEALLEFQVQRRAAEHGTLGYARELLKSGESNEARHYLRRYVAERHDDIAAYALLAELATRNGDYDEARAACEAALAQSPEALPIHLTLAKIAEQEKNYKAVAVHAQHVLDATPEDYHALILMAKAYDALGMPNEAAAAWMDLAERHNNLKDWLPAIRATAKTGNWEMALDGIHTAIAMCGPAAQVALTDLHIRSLFETSRLAEVEELLLRVGEHDLEKALGIIAALTARAAPPLIARLLDQLNFRYDLSRLETSRNLRFLLNFLEKQAFEKRGDELAGRTFSALIAKIRLGNGPPTLR